MSRTVDCPDCEIPLRAGRCTQCGWRPARAETAAAKATSHDGRCDFVTDGRRCFLPGESSKTRKTWYCGWHAMVLESPRLASLGGYDEFERWCIQALDAGYCCVWAHWRAAELWAAVRGERTLLATPPSACRQARCLFGVEQREAAAHAGQPIGRRESAALAQQVLTLAELRDVNALTNEEPANAE